MLDPQQLIELRETGRCTIVLPEILFDLDFPGQVHRRIKAVSLTIPCVTGPYTNVSARLTLDRSSMRHADPPHAIAPGFAACAAISTSTGQGDSGLFELNFRDERYLPFEGAGAVSAWTLELAGAGQPPAQPVQSSAVLPRPFDYDTISDVVLHLQYTARDSSSPMFRTQVENAIVTQLNAWIDGLAEHKAPLTRVFSLRQEFSSDFHRFLYPPPDESLHALNITIEDRHFPYVLREYFRRGRIETDEAAVLVKPRTPDDYRSFSAGAVALEHPPLASGSQTFALRAEWGGLPVATFTAPKPPEPPPPRLPPPTGMWTLQMHPGDFPEELRTTGDGGKEHVNPELVEDVYLVTRYRVTPGPQRP